MHGQTYRQSHDREAHFIDSFAATALSAAAAEQFDGIICGHLPHAVSRTVDGMSFFSTGDWRTYPSALIEHSDGQFEFIAREQKVLALAPAKQFVPPYSMIEIIRAAALKTAEKIAFSTKLCFLRPVQNQKIRSP